MKIVRLLINTIVSLNNVGWKMSTCNMVHSQFTLTRIYVSLPPPAPPSAKVAFTFENKSVPIGYAEPNRYQYRINLQVPNNGQCQHRKFGVNLALIWYQCGNLNLPMPNQYQHLKVGIKSATNFLLLVSIWHQCWNWHQLIPNRCQHLKFGVWFGTVLALVLGLKLAGTKSMPTTKIWCRFGTDLVPVFLK